MYNIRLYKNIGEISVTEFLTVNHFAIREKGKATILITYDDLTRMNGVEYRILEEEGISSIIVKQEGREIYKKTI